MSKLCSCWVVPRNLQANTCALHHASLSTDMQLSHSHVKWLWWQSPLVLPLHLYTGIVTLYLFRFNSLHYFFTKIKFWLNNPRIHSNKTLKHLIIYKQFKEQSEQENYHMRVKYHVWFVFYCTIKILFNCDVTKLG